MNFDLGTPILNSSLVSTELIAVCYIAMLTAVAVLVLKRLLIPRYGQRIIWGVFFLIALIFGCTWLLPVLDEMRNFNHIIVTPDDVELVYPFGLREPILIPFGSLRIIEVGIAPDFSSDPEMRTIQFVLIDGEQLSAKRKISNATIETFESVLRTVHGFSFQSSLIQATDTELFDGGTQIWIGHFNEKLLK
jgi:hypothetical protein